MRALYSLLECMLAVALTGIGQPAVAVTQGSQSSTQTQPPAEQVDPDPWPKTAELNGATYTLYQPQLESWDGYSLEGHAAVSVRPAGASEVAFPTGKH